MKILFENKQQVPKVRFILWLSIVLAIVAIYSGWNLFDSYGLAPADGGELKPLGTRLAVAGTIALLGCTFAAAMMLYAKLYLLRLERDGDQVIVRTLSPFGLVAKPIVINSSAFKEIVYFQGRQNINISVDAPWLRIKVTGRRLPFILDLKAEVINKQELKKLASF